MTTVDAIDTCARCGRTVPVDHPDRRWWEPLADGSGLVCEDCYNRTTDASTPAAAGTASDRYDAAIQRLREALTPDQFALVLELDRIVGDRLAEQHRAGIGGHDLERRVERVEEVIRAAGSAGRRNGRAAIFLVPSSRNCATSYVDPMRAWRPWASRASSEPIDARSRPVSTAGGSPGAEATWVTPPRV